MPSNYAHYRFGCLALQTLTGEQRRSIGRFRQLYDVGQHGPDMLFYYNPFWDNAVARLGSAFHGQTGREFFTNACAIWKAAPSEAAKVYLYGLLGHYCLDAVCHPFVKEQHSTGKVRHAELETDFDRYLLRMDGNVPAHLQNTGSHIRLTRGECVTAAAFFPPVTPAQLHRSIGSMRHNAKLLSHKNRPLLEGVLRLANENVRDHVMKTKPNPRCEALNPQLLELFLRALANYVSMVAQLNDHMENGTPLGPDFDPTFG